MVESNTIEEPVRAKPAAAKVAQKHFRTAEFDLPLEQFSGRLIRDVASLEELVEPWNRLIETSVRANPFFDPDFLIPAYAHLANPKVSILVIEAPRRVDPNAAPVICALLPVVKKRLYGLPVNGLEIWKHKLCFDSTPLVRRDCAAAVLEFVFEYIGRELKAGLFSLDTVIGEGIFSRLLTENCFASGRTVFHRDEFTRACFRPMDDAETFINTQVATSTRKDSKRMQRKLQQTGLLETHCLEHLESAWIDQFLSLESAGWKGKNQTALASSDKTKSFFREMAGRMLLNNKMIMSRTTLDQRPIAMSCDLKHNETSAHFKIAYDESLRDFSPGVILEMDNIHRLHETKTQFVDSCADPDHTMINRLWRERVRYQSLVIATGGMPARFAAAAMPLIQLTSKLLKKNR